MKKAGIVLLLCWPLSIAWWGLHSVFTPKQYYASAMIERNDATWDELRSAFEAIQPKPSDVILRPIENTDLVEVQARSTESQIATNNVNAVASAMMEKLPRMGARSPFLAIPAAGGSQSTSFPLIPNLLVGTAVGLVPATIGLILILLARRPQFAPA